MPRRIPPKNSIPLVCYHTETKSYVGIDPGHPLLNESYIQPIGSFEDFDMEGRPRHSGAIPMTAPEIDADSFSIPEPEMEEERSLGYTELKSELTRLGVSFKGNSSKAELMELYFKATET